MVKLARPQHGAPSVTHPAYQEWLDGLMQERPPEEVALIRRACECAEAAHRGQTRVSGEPYFQHALAVAQILAGLRMDPETVVAAILHDVVEDTAMGLAEIRQEFGPGIARLVDGVTKMGQIQGFHGGERKDKRELGRAESLRKMLLAMAEDVRVVLIKLADRLHNMRTLGSLPEVKRKRIARETMDIFAPLANRLGIWQVKWELEDLAFRHLEPEAYKQIAGMLAERRIDRERYIEGVVAQIEEELQKAGVKAEVSGRPKHIYGIWKKMRRKGKGFHEIYDVRAVRIVTDEIHDCYAALGIVHTLWQYIPGEFDDYIATPKENNYRSIHTAVIGPEGKTVEIQIRTHEMHRLSEYGVAAHWRYKEGAKADAGFDEKITWLRQLLEWKDEVAEASEFVDQFKSEVFSDRVYVFTPMGNVIDLPYGATPLDFAYRIHTEVGHRCRGAKVNGRIVPLTYKLKTGEQVEVLTVKKGGPSRDWLNPHLGYLVSSKARSKVQQWFRQQDHDNNVVSGRNTLERELKRLGVSDIGHDRLAARLGFNQAEDFYAAIGRGDLKNSQVLNAVQALTAPREPVSLPGTVTPARRQAAPALGAFSIQGVGNLLTQMAGCCKPVPGDPIVGYITRGRGVTVHRRDCANALRLSMESPERLVEVSWGSEAGATFPVDVLITAYDRHGLLQDITKVLVDEKINVRAVHTSTDDARHTARLRMTLDIPDLTRLSRVLARIEQLANVIEAHRRQD